MIVEEYQILAKHLWSTDLKPILIFTSKPTAFFNNLALLVYRFCDIVLVYKFLPEVLL